MNMQIMGIAEREVRLRKRRETDGTCHNREREEDKLSKA